MTTQETSHSIVKIDSTADNIFSSLPVDFIQESDLAGFSDRKFLINPTDISAEPVSEETSFVYEISFDGESELLGKVISFPQGTSYEQAAEALRGYFGNEEDEEEQEEQIA